MSTRTRWTIAPLLGFLLCAGCGPSQPETADPERGKEVLCAALDAWKQGESPQSLKDRSPPIHVNDPDWASGARLERYEVKQSEGKTHGYDYSCPVTLWLRSGPGGVKSRKVSYTIGLGGALVVVREMGG